MRTLVPFIILLCVGVSACTGIPKGTAIAPEQTASPGDILQPAVAETVTFDGMMARVRSDRAVFVGESHNNDHHHAFQARVVRALHEQDGKLLIGMEMFQRPFQDALDRFVAGETDEAQFLRESEYFTRWKWDYRYYRPIFMYARENRIPLVALNSPKEANRRVSRGGGLAALTPEDRKWVAKDIDLGIKEHRDFVMKVFENHPMGPGFNLEAFYASQCLWEDTMAESVATALDAHPGHRMVIIVGSGHVRKRFGIPIRAERRGATPYSILVGMDLMPGREAPTFGEFLAEDLGDFLYFTESAPKESPSPRLGVGLVPGEEGRPMTVTKVTEGSLAQRAGVLAQDLLVSINGEKIFTVEDLRIVLALMRDTVGTIEVERQGSLIKLPYTVGAFSP